MAGTRAYIKFEKESSTAKLLINNASVIYFRILITWVGLGIAPLLDRGVRQSFVMIDHHQEPDDYARISLL